MALSHPMPMNQTGHGATQFVGGSNGALPDMPLLARPANEGTNIFLINGNNNEVDGTAIAAQAKKGGSSTEGSSVGFSPAVTTIGGGSAGVPASIPPPALEEKKDKEFSIFDTMTNFLVRKV
jgi:hypothetical protein